MRQDLILLRKFSFDEFKKIINVKITVIEIIKSGKKGPIILNSGIKKNE